MKNITSSLLFSLCVMTVIGQSSLHITTSGTLTNHTANLAIPGNLSNDGTFTSTGTETFLGLSDQSISGIFIGSSHLGNIIKANTGNLILLDAVNTNQLTFSTDGTIDLESYNATLRIIDSARSAINGYDSVRYITIGNSLGYLYRTITDTSLGAWYTFPLGNLMTGYRPLNVNCRSLGLSSDKAIAVTLRNESPGVVHFSKNYPLGICSTQPAYLEFNCLQDYLWNVFGPVGSTYTVQAPVSGCGAGPHRIIAYPWDSIERVVGGITNQLCDYTDWTGTAPFIPGGTYRDFSQLTVAGTAPEVLPVTLISLDAHAIENSFVRVSWTTTTEISNKGFHVMRSTDGLVFSEIGFVPSTAIDGNSTESLSYFYDDNHVSSGVYYYRLYQEDQNGFQNKTFIVSATIKNTLSTFVTLYPNPCRDLLHIRSDQEIITMTLFNSMGQIIQDYPQQRIPLEIPMNIFPSGTYTIRILTNDNVNNVRVIKQ